MSSLASFDFIWSILFRLHHLLLLLVPTILYRSLIFMSSKFYFYFYDYYSIVLRLGITLLSFAFGLIIEKRSVMQQFTSKSRLLHRLRSIRFPSLLAIFSIKSTWTVHMFRLNLMMNASFSFSLFLFFLLVHRIGCWQGNTRSDSRSTATVSRACMECRATVGEQTEAMLWAFDRIGTCRTEITVTIGWRPAKSNTASRNTASLSETTSWNFGICSEIWRI